MNKELISAYALEPGAGFCFVGCTVAPGFDFDDFDLGLRATLSVGLRTRSK